MRSKPKLSVRVELSSRDLRLLRLIIADLGNKEIADRMGIHISTVKLHLAGLYTRLGVRGRLQAALWAARKGIGAEKAAK